MGKSQNIYLSKILIQNLVRDLHTLVIKYSKLNLTYVFLIQLFMMNSAILKLDCSIKMHILQTTNI